MEKVVLTCALTGVLTDPSLHPVPVTPEEMAAEARRAYEAGATVVHCHFRAQAEGRGHLPSWDPQVAADICAAIRAEVPELILNLSTGVLGADISGPLACLRAVKPEMAALNSGSLNYLKLRSDGSWAWPPMVFDNPVEKVAQFLKVMDELDIAPECECFDTGIVRSVDLFVRNGILRPQPCISLVMGVASGMPAKAQWLPLLKEEMPAGSHWQVIAIGREEVWPLLAGALREGGHIRTGLEDTFYLPDGAKAKSNGELVAAAAELIHGEGREIASAAEARSIYGLPRPPTSSL